MNHIKILFLGFIVFLVITIAVASFDTLKKEYQESILGAILVLVSIVLFLCLVYFFGFVLLAGTQ